MFGRFSLQNLHQVPHLILSLFCAVTVRVMQMVLGTVAVLTTLNTLSGLMEIHQQKIVVESVLS